MNNEEMITPVTETEDAIEETVDETVEETAVDETSVEEADAEPTPNESEVEQLKSELESLRRELRESRALYERLEGECIEFSELYPGVPLSSLPDSIWQSVKSGVPLAAAYALDERKGELARLRAAAINGENKNMSSGALKGDTRGDYFSPAEVKAMSASEVRANYTKIINSMSKWH